MRTKNWTIVGAIAAATVAVPVAWNAIELAVAIEQTPREIVQLRDEMTNSFSVMNQQIAEIDGYSRSRDSNIVFQLRGEINRNRIEARTNFCQLLNKLDGHYIEIDPPKSANTN